MRVGIIGSRKCDNLTVADIIAKLPKNCTKIVSGGASGVDSLARDCALELGLELIEILPDYQNFGREAPLVRNSKIIAQCDMVLAFWDMNSMGSADTIAKCFAAKVPIIVINLDQFAVH